MQLKPKENERKKKKFQSLSSILDLIGELIKIRNV